MTASRWAVPVLAAGLGSMLLCTAVTTGVVFFGTSTLAREIVDQPVAFSHKRHVEDQALECAACHSGCETGVSSGLPNVAACSLCHAEPQGESEAEREFVATIAAGRPVAWPSLFQQPAHIFFSHRRHTTVAKLECVTCHGDIAQSTAPPRVRSPLSMVRCIACHHQQGAAADCSTCHR